MIKVFGEDVLVKETLVKVERKVILDPLKDEEVSYTRTAIVVGVGEEAKEVPVNTIALFKTFAEPYYSEDTEGKKGANEIVRYAVYAKGMLAGCKPINELK